MSVRKHRVVLGARARSDLRAIGLYGRATWGTAQSIEYRAQIANLLASLADFPNLGRRTDLLSGEGRMISVGVHVVYYRIEENEVKIVRILHERTNPDDKLG